MHEQNPAGPEKTPDASPSTDYDALYKEAHPDAIDNKEKAEVMAYASRRPESRIPELRAEALNAASKVGGAGYESGPGMMDRAKKAVLEAEAARKHADQIAKDAGDVYDRVKKL